MPTPLATHVASLSRALVGVVRNQGAETKVAARVANAFEDINLNLANLVARDLEIPRERLAALLAPAFAEVLENLKA